MATNVDSTQSFIIDGPGGGGKPSSSIDSTQREVFPVPSANDGAGSRGVNASSPALAKPETPSIINSIFYDPTSGSPATLDSTMNSVLEISFNK
jgi:hypothetical protein